MNFFKKKDKAFISLQVEDLQAESAKLWSDLEYAIQGGGITQVKLRLNECRDISLKALSTVVSLALKLKQEGVNFELEGPRNVIYLIRKLNFASSFSELTEVA